MTPTPLVFHFYCIFINKFFSDFSYLDFFFKFQNFRMCLEPRFVAKIREADSKLKMVSVNMANQGITYTSREEINPMARWI